MGLDDEPETVSRLIALAEEIRERDLLTTSPQTYSLLVDDHSKRQNLPAELTSLIGRESDLAEVARLLTLPATRLLTLTGAGGCGKTRLALRTGRNLEGQFANGVRRLELAPLSDPAMLGQALISALGLMSNPDQRPIDFLIAFFCERKLLLVLDNCEHLIDAVARLVLELLLACPQLKILTTSREPLNVPGEITYRVPSLSLPPADDSPTIENYTAVQLFIDRANNVQPGYRPSSAEEAHALAAICRRLDGIPLAIELAAARVSTLSVWVIASRLEEGFRVLGPGARGVVPRHATLQATVAWSFDLLSQPERVLLRRLPLFAGSWAIEQAEEICADNEMEQEELLGRLVALVNKSLVSAERLPDGSMRYRLHEMVCQFAYEQLLEAGEEETLRRRFIHCFLHLSEQANPPDSTEIMSSAWQQRLLQEVDNIRQAVKWAQFIDIEAGLRLCLQFDQAILLNLAVEEVNWLEQLLTARAADTERRGDLTDSLILGKALLVIGTRKFFRGEHEVSLRAVLDSMAIFEAIGEPASFYLACAHLHMGAMG